MHSDNLSFKIDYSTATLLLLVCIPYIIDAISLFFFSNLIQDLLNVAKITNSRNFMKDQVLKGRSCCAIIFVLFNEYR